MPAAAVAALRSGLAASLLSDAQDGFLIHNVDILSNADLGALVAFGKGRAATLMVSERKTSRYLLFDDDMRLVGWTNIQTGEVKSPYPSIQNSKSEIQNSDRYRKLAFAGIHYMNPSLFRYFSEWPQKFSIIDFYLSICNREPIYGFVPDDLRLMDVGKIDTLAEADKYVASSLS